MAVTNLGFWRSRNSTIQKTELLESDLKKASERRNPTDIWCLVYVEGSKGLGLGCNRSHKTNDSLE